MTTIRFASVYSLYRIQCLTRFKASIVWDFNRALSSLRMCFVEKKTRSNSNDIVKIENVFIAIRISIGRRDL